jgi:hypothetical protein
MKLDCLKEKKELVSVVLLVASAFLAVLILVKVTGFFAASAKAESLVKKAVAQNETDASDVDKYFAKYKVLADALKKNNLFVLPAPKQHPVKEVSGIFGNEVLIKDKWYKVGDMVGDAKIAAIGPTQVTIEWDGKEKVFAPIDAAGSSQQGGSRGSRAVTKASQPGGRSAQMVAVGSEGRPMGGPGGKGVLGNLSEKERAKLQLRGEQKQKLLTEKEKSKKLLTRDAEKLLKRDTEKIQAKQKKDMAQKKKQKDDSKPKKEGTQGKIKKMLAK